MFEFLKRTWAEIDLDNLNYNMNMINNAIENKKIMAVVKADAYGHGDKMVVNELKQNGIDFFAVSNIEEALAIRKCDAISDILVLGFTPVKSAKTISHLNITQTVFSYEYAVELNEYCKFNNINVKAHLKLDTGMSRIGFCCKTDEEYGTIREVVGLSNIDFNGAFTHLSSADSFDDESNEYTKSQINQFNSCIQRLKDDGIYFDYIHTQNSAGIIRYNNDICNYARAGIIMYGVAPSEEMQSQTFKPVMSLKSVVAMVKTIKKGTAISYGRKFVAPKDMKVATVPIGYADGYPRLLSNRGKMIVNGVMVSIVGNVCMDQLMLDVTDVPDIKQGDIVTVIGKDKNQEITADDIAKIIGTIGYEIICLVGRRVPRIYKKNNQTIEVVDYILD